MFSLTLVVCALFFYFFSGVLTASQVFLFGTITCLNLNLTGSCLSNNFFFPLFFMVSFLDGDVTHFLWVCETFHPACQVRRMSRHSTKKLSNV